MHKQANHKTKSPTQVSPSYDQTPRRKTKNKPRTNLCPFAFSHFLGKPNGDTQHRRNLQEKTRDWVEKCVVLRESVTEHKSLKRKPGETERRHLRWLFKALNELAVELIFRCYCYLYILMRACATWVVEF